MGFLDKLFGDANQKFLKNLEPQIQAINDLEKKFKKLSDQELKNKSLELKKQAQEGTKLDQLLVPAFALIREAAVRTLNQRHFEVQLLGGIVLHQGQIAEMKTGEGKTLTSTLAVYLNALEGQGVHVITVNDYLAKRDTVWMGQIYDFLGLTIGVIQHEASFVYDSSQKLDDKDKVRDQGVEVVMDYLRPVERRQAYQADITYGTNNEFGFDYLRDNMAQDLKRQVQRKLHYAIVDEVDSILIDEARTPLIISAPAEESASQYRQFAQLVNDLQENTDYNIDEKMKACTLTEEGIKKMEKILGVENIYENQGLQTVHHIESALKAKTLFQKDRDYVVKENEIINIITGFAFVVSILMIFQQIVKPIQLFNQLALQDSFLDNRGTVRVRIPGMILVVFSYFYFLHNFIKFNKLKHILFAIFFLIVLILQGFRSITISILCKRSLV